MKTAIEKNREWSNEHMQKIVEDFKIPPLIEPLIRNSKRILDMGCGNGITLKSITRNFKGKDLIGIDISQARLDYLRNQVPEGEYLCCDVCSVPLKSNSIDLIIAEQIIEHLEEDKKLVAESHRLLKKKGYLYITSVIKKPFAIYRYRNRGKFVLDPTHEREYSSKEEFLRLFEEGFELKRIRIKPLIKLKYLRVPGYYIIESLFIKK